MKVQATLVDENGTNLLGAFYDSVKVREQCVIVKRGSKYGVYNKETLKIILDCEWDSITLHANGVKACKEGTFSFFRYDGLCLTEDCTWEKINVQEKGIIVSKFEFQGFWDYNGNQVFRCEYKRIECYPKAIIAFKDRKRFVYSLE